MINYSEAKGTRKSSMGLGFDVHISIYFLELGRGYIFEKGGNRKCKAWRREEQRGMGY